jgi:hypothetical protein
MYACRIKHLVLPWFITRSVCMLSQFLHILSPLPASPLRIIEIQIRLGLTQLAAKSIISFNKWTSFYEISILFNHNGTYSDIYTSMYVVTAMISVVTAMIIVTTTNQISRKLYNILQQNAIIIRCINHISSSKVIQIT